MGGQAREIMLGVARPCPIYRGASIYGGGSCSWLTCGGGSSAGAPVILFLTARKRYCPQPLRYHVSWCPQTPSGTPQPPHVAHPLGSLVHSCLFLCCLIHWGTSITQVSFYAVSSTRLRLGRGQTKSACGEPHPGCRSLCASWGCLPSVSPPRVPARTQRRGRRGTSPASFACLLSVCRTHPPPPPPPLCACERERETGRVYRRH